MMKGDPASCPVTPRYVRPRWILPNSIGEHTISATFRYEPGTLADLEAWWERVRSDVERGCDWIPVSPNVTADAASLREAYEARRAALLREEAHHA